MFEDLPARANGDAHIRRLGRNCTAEFVLHDGDAPHHVRIERGEVVDVARGPFRMRGSAFSIQADAAVWREFLRPCPRPGFHDIFAMSATGAARIEGDMNLLLTHLAYFKALLASLRAEA